MEDGWIVQISIDNDGILQKLYLNTVLSIFDSDLLGSKGINIDNSQDYLSKIYCFNESQEPAQTGDYLNGYVDKGLTTEFAEQFGSVKDDLSVFLLAFTETLAELKKLSSSIDNLLNNNQSNISSFITNLDEFSISLSENKDKLKQTVNNLSQLSKDLSDIEFKKMSNQINTTLLELEALLKNINEGSGTASKIINDKDLYEKITKTLESVKSLMEDIEKNPKKKYIKHVL